MLTAESEGHFHLNTYAVPYMHIYDSNVVMCQFPLRMVKAVRPVCHVFMQI